VVGDDGLEPPAFSV